MLNFHYKGLACSVSDFWTRNFNFITVLQYWYEDLLVLFDFTSRMLLLNRLECFGWLVKRASLLTSPIILSVFITLKDYFAMCHFELQPHGQLIRCYLEQTLRQFATSLSKRKGSVQCTKTSTDNRIWGEKSNLMQPYRCRPWGCFYDSNSAHSGCKRGTLVNAMPRLAHIITNRRTQLSPVC